MSSGGQQPASDLRMLLLMAGDVERNPGPEACSACKGTVKRTQPPVRCSKCGEKWHLKCLGVSWSKLKTIKKDMHKPHDTILWYNWTGHACSGSEGEDGSVGDSGSRAGDGREREDTVSGGDADDRGGSAGENVEDTQDDEQENADEDHLEWVNGRIKCDGCIGYLYQSRGQKPVVCQTCNDRRHQSCTKLTRDALKVVKRNKNT